MLDRENCRNISFEDLMLHYQPQIASDASRIIAVEALLRPKKPRSGWRTPADILARFSDPAEAEALDWWVLRTACIAALNWPTLTVGINVGADRFRDPTFAARLIELVDEIGVDPRRIELEIVESSYIGDFDAAFANITQLRTHGLRIALDDFGTGFSSLTYLLKLPIDKVKIDKSFVDGVGSIQSAVIVQAVVALARALGLKVTAEGVETEDQYRFLRVAGCHLIQGWLFAKAMPASEISRLVDAGIVPRHNVAASAVA
jgi:EAL domain-containing protein (putative c-di-GMP-specific phosphodiesterase class I)